MELYDHFLRVVMEGAELWPTVGGAASGGGWAKPHCLATAGTTIVIPGDSFGKLDSLPDANGHRLGNRHHRLMDYVSA